MKLTVVIPTANRPDMLATALHSIAQQSAVSQIAKVVVSENGGSKTSEEVCRRFGTLNIEYRMNEPPLPVGAHFHRLLTGADTEFVTLLCDDDWWYPWHVETALKYLDDQPERVAFCSQAILYDDKLEVTNRQMPRAGLTLFAPDADRTGTIIFSKEALFSLSWLYTPFHISTLVSRSKVLKVFSDVIEAAHPYYIDRILYPSLRSLGEVVYHVPETVGIRDHATNDAKTYATEEVRKAMRNGSDIIRQLGFAQGIDVQSIWKDSYAKTDVANREFIRKWAGVFCTASELNALGFFQEDKRSPYLIQLAQHWYRAFRSFPKPAIYDQIKALVGRRR